MPVKTVMRLMVYSQYADSQIVYNNSIYDSSIYKY